MMCAKSRRAAARPFGRESCSQTDERFSGHALADGETRDVPFVPDTRPVRYESSTEPR